MYSWPLNNSRVKGANPSWSQKSTYMSALHIYAVPLYAWFCICGLWYCLFTIENNPHMSGPTQFTSCCSRVNYICFNWNWKGRKSAPHIVLLLPLALLRYWHYNIHKFKVCNVLIWYTYTLQNDYCNKVG